MFAFSADTYMIRQKEIRKAECLREQRLKTSPKAGCARHAEWEWNISRRKNKDSSGLQVRTTAARGAGGYAPLPRGGPDRFV